MSIYILFVNIAGRIGDKCFQKYLSQVQVFFSYLQAQVHVLEVHALKVPSA